MRAMRPVGIGELMQRISSDISKSRAKQGINDLGPTGRGQVQERPPEPQPMRKVGYHRHKTTQQELQAALFVAVNMLRENMKRTDRRDVKPELDALEAVVSGKDLPRHHSLLLARMEEMQTEGLK